MGILRGRFYIGVGGALLPVLRVFLQGTDLWGVLLDLTSSVLDRGHRAIGKVYPGMSDKKATRLVRCT
jgi:hypothetical protein